MTISFCFLAFIVKSNGGIEFFHGTWQEALEKSKEEGKLIFVDAYTQWCGPCKMMAKSTFTDPEVGEFFNKNFINVKMDMEAAESKEFKRSFSVSAYPTLFWINSDNEAVHKSVGAKKPADLITTAIQAAKKNDQSGKYEAQYLEGNRDYDLVYNYVKALNQADKPSLKIANDYLDSHPDISNIQKEKFVFEACQEADSKLCKSLMESASNLKKEFGTELWDEKIEQISWKTVEKAIEFEYMDLLDEAVEVMNQNHSNPKPFEYEAKMMYHSFMKNAQEYEKYNKDYYKKYAKKDPNLIKTLIDQMKSRFLENKDIMENAEDYAKQLTKLEKTEAHYIEYIQMLTVNNKKDKAKEVCEDAIKTLTKIDIKSDKISAYLKHLNKE